MARTRRGRGAKAQGLQEDDPVINLYIAIVERSRLDLAIPSDSRSSLRPTEYDRETAAQLLDSLYEAACRRQMGD